MPNKKDQNCLFCAIIQGESPSYEVYENEQVLAFLDIFPQAEGHTLIIPKQHSVNLLDTAEDQVSAVMTVTQKLAVEYQTALGADGFVVKIHNGEIANQLIPHFHVHLIPVYKEQAKNAKYGRASNEQLKSVAQTITSHLEQS